MWIVLGPDNPIQVFPSKNFPNFLPYLYLLKPPLRFVYTLRSRVFCSPSELVTISTTQFVGKTCQQMLNLQLNSEIHSLIHRLVLICATRRQGHRQGFKCIHTCEVHIYNKCLLSRMIYTWNVARCYMVRQYQYHPWLKIASGNNYYYIPCIWRKWPG